ncbi:hypothetical protein CONPUDRAFT_116008 [Coniophora puteana RWD-64-598 SS2]|uniref:Uncharacterized protein n=1 Tax=Coniophora puteana (strain RWD-64-598) TaxID=741705 RepID=A0A5M3N6E9_CONPW|nr:uncharacterized protein CONPUDRAFT_116008 [Coniophora puteana RWD-64-598 SS2]EIW87020.1 hypothetical protein CONPUDRAFT_116008 [Coniophora puteana RWD-64-598 SS2]
MGNSELSYYLPSRADGVNDMYLHIGFNAPDRFLDPSRVCAVWAILRLRHPALASRVHMHSYDDIRFVLTPPRCPEDALERASASLEYKHGVSKDAVIDEYLNGPRTLSNERLSYLIVSQPHIPLPSPSSTLPESAEDDSRPMKSHYDILFCAMHYLGDGMALHQFANDFFKLLGGSHTQPQLDTLLCEEWQACWAKAHVEGAVFANAMEDRLGQITANVRFKHAVARIDFRNDQNKLIGGQSFPRPSAKRPRHTIVPTKSYDAETTKKVLKRCKANSVSISAALFSICNLAWARLSPKSPELPMMMYSALNLRPYLEKRSLHDSYWFLAIGYFNVILPTFVPKGSPAATFWLRAHCAKEQSSRAVKSKMVVYRSRLMAEERARRAKAWGKEDDEKENGTRVGPPPIPRSPPAKPPSGACMGLSLLGNLDGIYQHGEFADVGLHTLTTGSRQRQGGMLLFGYTFAGKLWISFGYDEHGFDETASKFWDNVLKVTDEFLIA